MADVFWISVVFISFSSHLVVSYPGRKCGPPTQSSDIGLEERYLVKREFNDGDRVTYKCKHGFSHSGGSRFSFCQKGVWSPLELQCKKKICGSAGEILNGRFSQTGNAFGDTAQAVCNQGYVLHGEPDRECRANGWSGTIPSCVADDFATSAPDTAATCPPPRRSKNATYYGTKATYEPGETLTFSCKDGFQLIGNSNVLQCERTGMWNPRHGNCQTMPFQVTCPRPAVPNSNRQDEYKTEYVVEEHATISCQEGFVLMGLSQVTCGADGQWQEFPECRFAGGKCQSPPHVPNAHTEHGNYRHYESNTAVHYKCNHGYRMVRGPSSVYCRNGRWTDVQMMCQKKRCGSAGEIMNGRYHYTGASFGDTATAQCHRGYFVVGVAVRHCTAYGWDGREAECEAVQCPDPPRVPDADLIFDTSGIIKHGYMASYRCRFGTLIGASDITCTEDGTWSDPAPQCKVICPTPNVQFGVIVSGMRPRYHFKSSVAFRCNPGKKLVSSGIIMCGMDGHWKPKLPVCV